MQSMPTDHLLAEEFLEGYLRVAPQSVRYSASQQRLCLNILIYICFT